jgi:hypothetical protein
VVAMRQVLAHLLCYVGIGVALQVRNEVQSGGKPLRWRGRVLSGVAVRRLGGREVPRVDLLTRKLH